MAQLLYFVKLIKIRIHGFICQVVNMRAIVLYVQAILLVVTMMPQYEKSVLQLLLSLRIRLVKRLFWITCLVSLSIQSILLIIITNVLIRFRTHILEKWLSNWKRISLLRVFILLVVLQIGNIITWTWQWELRWICVILYNYFMILTTIRSMNARQPSWRIVREWDEIIASNLNLNLVSENRLSRDSLSIA